MMTAGQLTEDYQLSVVSCQSHVAIIRVTKDGLGQLTTNY